MINLVGASVFIVRAGTVYLAFGFAGLSVESTRNLFADLRAMTGLQNTDAAQKRSSDHA